MNNDLQLSTDEIVILVVSSHVQLRNHYSKILTSLNATVITVSDGFEALALMRNTKVMAILSDFRIPGMNGLELFLRIKELLCNIPFVICCDRISVRARDEALKIGVLKVLTKPSNKAMICETLVEAIEERHRQILQFFC
ncbi:MAG: response regulator [Chitinophagaceae bacterium]|nr:response regulator [Oligoflexus sp.]